MGGSGGGATGCGGGGAGAGWWVSVGSIKMGSPGLIGRVAVIHIASLPPARQVRIAAFAFSWLCGRRVNCPRPWCGVGWAWGKNWTGVDELKVMWRAGEQEGVVIGGGGGGRPFM